MTVANFDLDQMGTLQILEARIEAGEFAHKQPRIDARTLRILRWKRRLNPMQDAWLVLIGRADIEVR